MKDMYAAIVNGDYNSKLPYYFGNEKVPAGVDMKAANEAYRADQAVLYAQFKTDALEYVGLAGHPKADKVWAYAWEEGHSSGYHSVLQVLEEVAELVK